MRNQDYVTGLMRDALASDGTDLATLRVKEFARRYQILLAEQAQGVDVAAAVAGLRADVAAVGFMWGAFKRAARKPMSRKGALLVYFTTRIMEMRHPLLFNVDRRSSTQWLAARPAVFEVGRASGADEVLSE
ncbi:hypothetical protein [Azospirillum argentinense]